MDDELKELQDPANWADDGDDELRPPAKKSRAIVSVAFSRSDFERVVVLAQQRGLKTSEFIRKSALGEFPVAPHPELTAEVSGVANDYRPPRTEGPRVTVHAGEFGPEYDKSWTTP